MQIAQQVYVSTVKDLPTNEQLELASLILAGVTQKQKADESLPEMKTERHSVLELLADWPGQRLFQTSAEADAYLRGERDSWDR
jgi:hypothetical protein